EDLIVLLIEAGIADRDEDVPVVPRAHEVVVYLDVEIPDLHGDSVGEELVHLTDALAVCPQHFPSSNIGVAVGDLVVVQFVQRSGSVSLERHYILPVSGVLNRSMQSS